MSYWADSHARQRILFCFLACFSYIAVPTHTHKAETRLQGNSPATVYHNSHTPCYIYIVGLYKYIYTPTVQQRYFTAQNTPPLSLYSTLQNKPNMGKFIFYPCHCTFTMIYRARNTGFSHRTFLTVVYPSCSAAASGIMPSHNNGIKGIVG